MNRSIDLFCTVIDNYGDAGVTYRLARILSKMGYAVTLFINNLSIIKRLNSNIDDKTNKTSELLTPQKFKEQQLSENLVLRYWIPEDSTEYDENSYRDFTYIPSQIIIEAFQCNLPKEIVKKFTNTTIWINLEYLSAEKWIEDCHKLPSIQKNNVNKYFFFPGFTTKTGGLNFEEQLSKKSKEQAIQDITKLFKTDTDLSKGFKVLIFTYENKALIQLLKAIITTIHNPILFLPDGKSTKYLENNEKYKNLLKENPTLKIIKFEMINQENFDILLKAMDLNVVRGEDSFAQSNMIGVPFLWHIYPQDEDTHLVKLQAFTDLYTENCPDSLKNTIEKAFFSLNNSDSEEESESLLNFNNFMIKYPEICTLSAKWSEQLLKIGNLGRHLDSFIQKTQNILKVNK